MYEKYHQNFQTKNYDAPSINSSKARSLLGGDGSPLHVYTDIPQVEEFLTRPEFVISMCYGSLAVHFFPCFSL